MNGRSNNPTASLRDQGFDSNPIEMQARKPRAWLLGAICFWILVALGSLTGLYSLTRIFAIQTSNYDDLHLDNDLRLTVVPEFLGSDFLGIKRGDKIVMVNNQKVGNPKEYGRERRNSRAWSTRMLLQNFEDGATTEVLFLVNSRHPILSLDKDRSVIASEHVDLAALGLTKTDRIIAVNRDPVKEAGTIDLPESTTSPLLYISVDRSARDLPPLQIGVLRLDPGVPWIHFFLGGVFLVLGSLVYRVKPMRKTSWGFLIFCSIAALFYFLRAIPAGFRTVTEYQIFRAVIGLSPFPLLLLIGTYTPLRRMLPNFLRLLLVSLSAGIILNSLGMVLDTVPYLLTWGGVLLLMLLATTFMDKLFALFKVAVDPIDLQRSSSMRLALIVAFAPSVFYLILRLSTGAGAGLQFWFELTPFAFPAVISYAILRQNFLRINELLLEGVVFSALMLTVGGTYGAIVGSVGPLLGRFSADLSPVATGVFTGLLAGFSMPVYARIRRALERHYERQQARYDELIQSIENDNDGSATVEGFCDHLIERLRRLAETPNVRIVSYLPQSGGMQLFANAEPSIAAGLMQSPDRSLVALLERRQDGIYREELDDAVLKGQVEQPLAELMTQLQAIMLFPILVENRLTALLALGNKVTRKNYSKAEIAKIRHVARCMTVGFYGFAMQRRGMEKQQAENALQKSEDRFRLIAENAQDVIYRYALVPAAAMEYVSPSVEGFTGHTPEEFSTNPDLFFSVIHPEDVSLLRSLIARMPDRPQELELRWVCREGGTHIMEQRIVPVRDSNGILVAIEGIARDVTERRRAENERQTLEAQLRQAQKLEAVGTLASGIAHDIGNLLTAISGFTAIARTTLTQNHPAAESLKNVEEAASRAGGISKSLLTFTKEVRGARVPINLTQLVSGSTRMLQRFLPASVKVVENFDIEDEVWIEADENQMSQVLFNLVINARDAMPLGGTTTISLLRETDNSDPDHGTCAVLVVEDTGEGIPETLRDRIFEPFFTTKPSGKGTGLGLSVTHGIVESHGGTIRFQSAHGLGARFEVRFPCCGPSEVFEVSAEATAPVTGNGEPVLIAEDDEMVRHLISLRLTDLNYAVSAASDGGAFMDAFRSSHADLAAVILDIDLPVLSGIECFHQVRRQNPDLLVILMTANPSEEIENLLDAHTILLRKPFPVNALADLIGRRMANPPLEDDLEASS